MTGRRRRREEFPPILGTQATPAGLDLAHVKGQEAAKRALEVAAAGNHSILLVGPRSAGKTMLARCLPGLLPPPTEDEAAATAGVYQRANLDPPDGRPFRVPHFSTRPTRLVGRDGTPGEVDLARGGVLFLDDLPAFGKRCLRAVRRALEEVPPQWAGGDPDHRPPFMLIAAMRSCPCGHLHDWRRHCSCAPWEFTRYWSAVDELVLDLIQLHAEVSTVCLSTLRSRSGEESRQVAERVAAARDRQLRREGQATWNAHLRPWALPKFCEADPSGRKLLESAQERIGLTVREVSTILRIARTSADLAGSERVRVPDVAEAVQYRLDARRQREVRTRTGTKAGES
jgi:magnesium chelatase family protein